MSLEASTPNEEIIVFHRRMNNIIYSDITCINMANEWVGVPNTSKYRFNNSGGFSHQRPEILTFQSSALSLVVHANIKILSLYVMRGAPPNL